MVRRAHHHVAGSAAGPRSIPGVTVQNCWVGTCKYFVRRRSVRGSLNVSLCLLSTIGWLGCGPGGRKHRSSTARGSLAPWPSPYRNHHTFAVRPFVTYRYTISARPAVRTSRSVAHTFLDGNAVVLQGGDALPGLNEPFLSAVLDRRRRRYHHYHPHHHHHHHRCSRWRRHSSRFMVCISISHVDTRGMLMYGQTLPTTPPSCTLQIPSSIFWATLRMRSSIAQPGTSSLSMSCRLRKTSIRSVLLPTRQPSWATAV